MRNKHRTRYSNQQLEAVKKYAAENTAFQLKERSGGLFIAIDKNITDEALLPLLNLLWENGFEIAFHDTIHPSVTDPGAYFAYYSKKSSDKEFWAMTYGNHGWSGGMYRIRNTTVAKQIGNLIRRSQLQEIQITGVTLLSHYVLKEKAESEKIDAKIRQMHEV